MMDRQLSHLVRLVDDLLDVSRVTQGKVELRKKQIALSEILKTAVEASNPLISAGRHELIVDLPDTEVWLDADLTRLSQVVSNLLTDDAEKRESSARRSGLGRSLGRLFLPRHHHPLVGLLGTPNVVGFSLSDLLDPIVATWSRLAIFAWSAGLERSFA